MLLILCNPLSHYFITILPLPSLYIITGIIFLNIPNPPLDCKATFSPYKKLSETFPRAARGSVRPRIISFPLNDLINFLKNIPKGLKKRPRGLGKKTHSLRRQNIGKKLPSIIPLNYPGIPRSTKCPIKLRKLIWGMSGEKPMRKIRFIGPPPTLTMPTPQNGITINIF